VDDFMKPDRIVIGTTSMRAKELMSRLYKPFVRQGNPVIFMDERSAEMTKYAANAFLATKISFMNEIANLSEKAGADVDMVRLGIGADERIGKRFLFPGIGYGGSCFPKDVAALARIAADYAYDFKIVKAVEAVNTIQKTILAQKIMNYYKGNVKDRSFALWGLAFKPDTDDIREAPSLQIIKELTEAGARITAYDPEATENVRKLYGDNKMLHFSGDPYEVLKEADALLIATEWSEFRSPDFDRLKQNLKQPVIFDGRNLYSLEEMQEQNFYYESIGRRTIEGSIR
jgi:UDPglucose 6-dehydrogenase